MADIAILSTNVYMSIVIESLEKAGHHVKLFQQVEDILITAYSNEINVFIVDGSGFTIDQIWNVARLILTQNLLLNFSRGIILVLDSNNFKVLYDHGDELLGSALVDYTTLPTEIERIVFQVDRFIDNIEKST